MEAANRGREAPPEAVAAARGLRWLRRGLGVVWALNLVYIVLPANDFFGSFSATAASFGATSLGGPGFPAFVASFPTEFALLIAGATAYLATAFLTGRTIAFACGVGIAFNALLLVSQVGTLTTVPGGTDIGPMPLYLLAYGTLLAGLPRRELGLRLPRIGSVPGPTSRSGAAPGVASASHAAAGLDA